MRPTLCLTLAALALSPQAARGQSSWQDQLREEIAIVEECEVQLLSQVVERKIGDRQVVMAKVHCADGRAFDAYRDDELAPFSFKECTPTRDTSAC